MDSRISRVYTLSNNNLALTYMHNRTIIIVIVYFLAAAFKSSHVGWASLGLSDINLIGLYHLTLVDIAVA